MKKFFALVALLCTVMISSTAIYVDNNSIRRDYNYSGYVFRAFVKQIFNEAGHKKAIEIWRTNGEPLPKGIYNLSHHVSLEYFKTSGGIKYWSSLNRVYYTHDGNTIPEMGYSFSSILKWFIISPDTVGEIKFDKIYARVPN